MNRLLASCHRCEDLGLTPPGYQLPSLPGLVARPALPRCFGLQTFMRVWVVEQLVSGLMGNRLYFGLESQNATRNNAFDHSRVGCRFFNGQSIDAAMLVL